MSKKKDYYIRIRSKKTKSGINYYLTITNSKSEKSYNYEHIFKTKTEAKSKKAELETDYNRGELSLSNDNDSISIQKFFETFVDWKINIDPKSRWNSARNIHDYKNQIQYFLNFCRTKNIENLSEIDSQIILAYQGWVAKQRNLKNEEYSDSYKRKLFGIIKSAFSFGFKKDFLKFDPTAKFDNFIIDTEKQERARPLTKSEIISFMENCNKWTSEKNKQALDYSFFKDYFLILLYSGMRAEEGVLLQKNDFYTDSEFGILYINLPGWKTKKKYSRIIPIHPKIKSIVENLLEKCNSESDYIFRNRVNEPLQRDNALKIFKKIARRAGLEGKVTTGSTRKTFITIGTKFGKDEIQKIAGHRDSSVTGNVYHMPNVKQLYDVLIKIDFGIDRDTNVLEFQKKTV